MVQQQNCESSQAKFLPSHGQRWDVQVRKLDVLLRISIILSSDGGRSTREQ